MKSEEVDDLLARLGALRLPSPSSIAAGQIGGELLFEHGTVSYDEDRVDDALHIGENAGRISAWAGRNALVEVALRADALRAGVASASIAENTDAEGARPAAGVRAVVDDAAPHALGAPSDGAEPTRNPIVPDSSAKKTATVRIKRAEVARRLNVHVQTLDALIDSAPKNLPGSPLRIGDGKKRRHYRWNPDTFEAWIEAVQAWRAGRGKRPR